MTETLAERLDRLMREAGYNPRSLSLAAGLGPTAVRDILEHRIQSPRYATVEALGKVLGVGAGHLAGGGAADAGAPNSIGRAPEGAGDGLALGRIDMRSNTGVRDLPVYAAAQGGAGGSMVISSDPIQWVNRPEPLAAVPTGYGVYVVGDSMNPAYEQGDIVLVHPGLPPRRDTDVILVRHEPDGTRHALIKRLTGWSDSHWRIRQYNPRMEMERPRSEWVEIQAIVGKYHGR